jgi:hypothetical protein
MGVRAAPSRVRATRSETITGRCSSHRRRADLGHVATTNASVRQKTARRHGHPMVIVAPGRRRYNRPSALLRACRRPVNPVPVQRHNRSARLKRRARLHLRPTPMEAEIQAAREVVKAAETRDTITAIRTITVRNRTISRIVFHDGARESPAPHFSAATNFYKVSTIS